MVQRLGLLILSVFARVALDRMRALALVLTFALAGCGSIANLGEPRVHPLTPYGGVGVDAGVVVEIVTGEPWALPLLIFAPLDITLCSIVDTCALPYTLTHWEHPTESKPARDATASVAPVGSASRSE